MMYDVALSRVERIKQRCNVFIRKWLGLPKMLTSSALYGKSLPLNLPLASIAEEYKAGKVRTIMTLRYSKDPKIKDNPPEVRSGGKWNAEQEVNNLIDQLEHKDIVGSVQTNREGLGARNFKPFRASNRKVKQKAVVSELRTNENERRKVSLVQCSVQGQCLQWESVVVERKLSWKDIWNWETARISFLIKSTYDVLPSPVNLKRWKQSQEELCKCGQRGTMKHILSHCALGLDRRTWRHNQVLKVLENWLTKKVKEINDGKGPKIVNLQRINFVREGKAPSSKNSRHTRADKRWSGRWKIAVDLDTPMVFPLVASAQRPDIVMWSDEKRKAVIMELTVSWEDNIKAAEQRKLERYEELIERCEEDGWDVDYYHIGIGARGFIDKAFISVLRSRIGFSQSEVSKLSSELQETVGKASMWLWLKRNDPSWTETSNQNANNN